MAQPIPLNADQHAHLRIRAGIDSARLGTQHVAPLVVHEFAQAGCEFPVVFVKNANNEQCRPVAMLGLEPGENLFVHEGQWTGVYLPQVVQNDPFRLLALEANSDKFAVAVEDSSALLSEEDGEALFDADGKPTAYLEQRREALNRYFEHDQVSRGFVALLTKLELLQERELTIDLLGRTATVSGVYLVDTDKLAALSDEQTLDLSKRGYLQAIHAHLMSLSQLRRLARMKVKMSAAD